VRLVEHPRAPQTRNKVLAEMVKTEQTYGAALGTIHQFYSAPLKVPLACAARWPSRLAIDGLACSCDAMRSRGRRHGVPVGVCESDKALRAAAACRQGKRELMPEADWNAVFRSFDSIRLFQQQLQVMTPSSHLITYAMISSSHPIMR
jgi:hypothetical protein